MNVLILHARVGVTNLFRGKHHLPGGDDVSRLRHEACVWTVVGEHPQGPDTIHGRRYV